MRILSKLQTILLLPMAASWAAEPATRPAAPSTRPEAIQQLVSQLDDENWRTRQMAQDALVGFGDDATQALKTLVAGAQNEEVRARAMATLSAIDQNKLVGPTLITLHLRNATPQDAFAQFAREAGVEIKETNGLWTQLGDARVTLDADRQPFWSALRDLCQKSGAVPQANGQMPGGVLQLAAGNQSNWFNFACPSSASGPFVTFATRMTQNRTVDLMVGQNSQRQLNLQMAVLIEPKLHINGQQAMVKVDEAVDDRGNDLSKNNQFGQNMASGNGWFWNANINLNTRIEPAKAGKVIKKLKGSIAFSVQTRTEKVEILDIQNAKNVSKTAADRHMTVQSCTKQGEQYVLQVTLSQDDLSPFDFQQMLGNPSSMMRMYDAEGRMLTGRYAGGGGGVGQTNCTFQFTRQDSGGDVGKKPGEPVKLIWEAPLETRQMTVPFEFTDLPIP